MEERRRPCGPKSEKPLAASIIHPLPVIAERGGVEPYHTFGKVVYLEREHLVHNSDSVVVRFALG